MKNSRQKWTDDWNWYYGCNSEGCIQFGLYAKMAIKEDTDFVIIRHSFIGNMIQLEPAIIETPSVAFGNNRIAKKKNEK